MSYFDWNATAPMLPSARTAWLEASEKCWANASTAYRMGARARLALEGAREELGLLSGGIPAERIVFTGGATEANNAIIREAARRSDPLAQVWISAVEHPSVQVSARHYWGDRRVRPMPVLPGGRLDLDWLGEALERERPGLVALMAVNNETGVIQPWQEVARLCRQSGVPFLCDAAQWFGKLPAAHPDWGQCSAVVGSAHKFGGPKGTGFIILGEDCRGWCLLAGGSQELGVRAGTEDAPAILSMLAALGEVAQNSHDPAPRDLFEAGLREAFAEQVHLHGEGSSRVGNTCSVSLPRHAASRWVSRLDRLGFQVSSGTACSTGKAGPSPVLAAMGLDPVISSRTIRISAGCSTTPDEWRGLLAALVQARTELDAESSGDGPGQVIQIGL